MPKWLDEGIKPDVIFVDPPRKGLDETLLNQQQQLILGESFIFHVILQPLLEMLYVLKTKAIF